MAIDQTITQPRADAQALVTSRPYTTRLFTTMSAGDMTLDPEFRVDTSLPAVPNVRSATLVTQCDPAHFDDEAARVLEVPSGISVPYSAARAHGTVADYCARHGGYPPGMGPDVWYYMPDAAHPRFDGGGASFDGSPRVDGSGGLIAGGGGGCTCRVGSRGPRWTLSITLVIVIVRFRRARSRRTTRA
jgi:hypothetical protein